MSESITLQGVIFIHIITVCDILYLVTVITLITFEEDILFIHVMIGSVFCIWLR